LHNTSKSGQAEAAEALLSHGLNPNVKDSRGQTPLLAAATRQNPSLVRMLLEKGSDVNTIYDDGQSALSVAAGHGHQPDCVQDAAS